MSDAITRESGINEWSALLEETRLALSTLRAQDLAELAARAECMLFATVGHDAIRQRIPRPSEQELLELTKGRHLLSDLLIATDRNLKVLSRIRGRQPDRTRAGESDSRWVR